MGVGIRVKEILREKNMTIKELSQKTDISLNTLYSITKRDSKRIDPIILQRIANVVELPESFFLENQPFQDLSFLDKFKSIIIHSLCQNGYINFENRDSNQIGNCEYWKCIGNHIVSIVQIDNNLLSIQYKGKSKLGEVPEENNKKNHPTETQKAPTLNKKDERDISKDLERLRQDLESADTLMFDGDPMSDEARETILAAMKLGLEAAKIKNKEKYTPKKYKNN